jgi:hypothetical protein
VRTAGRWAMRISLLALAGAMVIAVVHFSVRSVPAEITRRGGKVIRIYRRRPLEPRPGRIGEFGGQVLLIGLGALAGLKILRLRL